MDYKLRYPGFCKKAVTLSYDDGTFYDVILTDIINKYGLKCTFNINSGLFGAIANLEFCGKTVFHNRISAQQSKLLYKNHEIASHSLSHPLLVNQNNEFYDKQVMQDKKNLEEIFECKVVGFAYPGGPYDDNLNKYLSNKFLYARSVDFTYGFDIPKSFIPLHPTVFHMDEKFIDLCRKYSEFESDEMSLCNLMGHSYEFAFEQTYNNFIEMCKIFSNDKNIFFATNAEIVKYLLACQQIKYKDNIFINDTELDIYLEKNGKNIIVPAKPKKLKVKHVKG